MELPPDCTVVAMTNFFAAAFSIGTKFDLKGSTVGRAASEKEKSKKSPVLKDLDWVRLGRKLRLPTKEERDLVSSQLWKDGEFLRDNNLIDYSMLVGVHDCCWGEDYDAFEPMDVIAAKDNVPR